MISVVCPTHNAAAYLQCTLRSILDQTFLPSEVVFSDDGSTDGTVNILKEWKGQFQAKNIRTKIICNSHNGPGAARNAGISAAKEEWIAFLDADDTWMPEKLQKIIHTIKENPDCNTILHWEEHVSLDGSVRILPHGKGYDVKMPLSKQLYRGNFFSPSALVLKNKLLEKQE